MAIYNKKLQIIKTGGGAVDCNIYSTLTEINNPAHYLDINITGIGRGYVPLVANNNSKVSPFQVTIGDTNYRAQISSGTPDGSTTLNTNTQYTFTVPAGVYCVKFTGNGWLSNNSNNIDEVGWCGEFSNFNINTSHFFCLPGYSHSIYSNGNGSFKLEWGDSINKIFFNALNEGSSSEYSDYESPGFEANYDTIASIINSWSYETEGYPGCYISESMISFSDFRTDPGY